MLTFIDWLPLRYFVAGCCLILWFRIMIDIAHTIAFTVIKKDLGLVGMICHALFLIGGIAILGKLSLILLT